MPVSYSGLNEEHLAVRNSVGRFDISHTSKGRRGRITSNVLITDGKTQYSAVWIRSIILIVYRITCWW